MQSFVIHFEIFVSSARRPLFVKCGFPEKEIILSVSMQLQHQGQHEKKSIERYVQSLLNKNKKLDMLTKFSCTINLKFFLLHCCSSIEKALANIFFIQKMCFHSLSNHPKTSYIKLFIVAQK